MRGPKRALVACLSLGLASISGGALAAPLQETPTARGGSVVILDDADRHAHDMMMYAPSRRAGDFIFVSGVTAGARAGEGEAEYRANLRALFERLGRTLEAYGAGYEDIVMMRSHHVWDSSRIAGGRQRHFDVFCDVKAQFMKAPHAGWTAVAASSLLDPDALVEVEFVVWLPQSQGRAGTVPR